MKDNLKTFPKADFTIKASDATKSQYIVKTMVWYESFREELQQLKQKASDFIEEGTLKDNLEENVCWYRGKLCIPIDEILGENQHDETK